MSNPAPAAGEFPCRMRAGVAAGCLRPGGRIQGLRLGPRPQPPPPARRKEGPPSSADPGLGCRRKAKRPKGAHRVTAPPRNLPSPPSRSPVASQAHLSPRLTCATGRRMKRRARAAEVGPFQPAGSAPRPGGRSGPALGPGCSVPPCPRPPTSCVAPREEVARSAGPGGPQVGSPAGKARAGRLRLRDLAGGHGWARPGHLAVPPASPSPPGRWAPT